MLRRDTPSSFTAPSSSTYIFSANQKIEVIKRRVQGLRLRMSADGSFRMSVPYTATSEEIQKFVDRSQSWIEKMVRERETEKMRTYADGKYAYLWGEAYRLVLIEGAMGQTAKGSKGAKASSAPHALKDGDRIVIVVESEDGALLPQEIEKRKIALEKLRSSELKAQLPAVSSWAEAVVGEKAQSWSVRTMHTRWGSCTPKTRKIRLSSELAAFPVCCLESVAIHECVHLIEPSHNARFHALQDKFYPKWKEARKILNAKEYL